MSKFGLMHVYTGDGKGKTSAAMGLAVRAVGQGGKVMVIQFMKGGAYTGEMIASKNFLPNITFEQYGRNCIKEEKQTKLMGLDSGVHYFDYVRDDIECGECRYCFLNDDLQKKYVARAKARAIEILKSEEYNLVVLDELCAAVLYKMMSTEEILEIITHKHENTELVITGRGAPQELLDKADYVTIMQQKKHPMEKGIFARRGVEY